MAGGAEAGRVLPGQPTNRPRLLRHQSNINKENKVGGKAADWPRHAFRGLRAVEDEKIIAPCQQFACRQPLRDDWACAVIAV